MRLSVVLLLCSLLGVVGGAALIGRWAVGVAVIADSVAVAAWALLRDEGDSQPSAQVLQHGKTLQQVLDQAARSG
jgi:hypothetical protein